MRIKNKVEEIETYLQELFEIKLDNFEDYKKDFKTKAACKRYFEKIIESVVDLAFLVVKEKNLKIPEDDKSAFDILKNASIISEKLSNKLKDAKGMRNILAHKYGSVDDELIFETITTELQKDVIEFLKNIKSSSPS